MDEIFNVRNFDVKVALFELAKERAVQDALYPVEVAERSVHHGRLVVGEILQVFVKKPSSGVVAKHPLFRGDARFLFKRRPKLCGNFITERVELLFEELV